TSLSSSIYKIAIDMNTPTTRNNQFKALNAPTINLHSLFLYCYELKPTSLSLCLYIHPKSSSFVSIFIQKCFTFHTNINTDPFHTMKQICTHMFSIQETKHTHVLHPTFTSYS